MNGFLIVLCGFLVVLAFGLACSWSITQIYRFARIRRVLKKAAVDPEQLFRDQP